MAPFPARGSRARRVQLLLLQSPVVRGYVTLAPRRRARETHAVLLALLLDGDEGGARKALVTLRASQGGSGDSEPPRGARLFYGVRVACLAL